MKSFLFILALTLLFAVGAGQAPRNATKDAMRFKLHYAQRIIEGLSMEDYALISTNAYKLKHLSQAAEWRVRSTAEYQRLTADYERAAESLMKAATHRNVDAATVAYFQLTVSCVGCHKYLRGSDVASLSIAQQAFAAFRSRTVTTPPHS